MDLNNIKEEFISLCRNFYNSIINSQVFYFVQDKYHHLNPLYRKILQGLGGAILTILLLYYPISLLYSSHGHIRDSKTKQKLMQDLMALSFRSSTSASGFYSSSRNPVPLIRQKMRALQIPQKQIQSIRKISNNTKSMHLTSKGPSTGDIIGFTPKGLNVPAKAIAVQVSMKNLNLKEVVQHGHRMEQISDNIKLASIQITETPHAENYFNVSYILNIFQLVDSKTAKGKSQASPLNKIRISGAKARIGQASSDKTLSKKTSVKQSPIFKQSTDPSPMPLVDSLQKPRVSRPQLKTALPKKALSQSPLTLSKVEVAPPPPPPMTKNDEDTKKEKSKTSNTHNQNNKESKK